MVGLAAGVIYFLVVLPVIFSGRIPARPAYDDLMYHEPAIREFARQWPHFYFYDYLSATTPGYHLLQAAIVRFVSPSRVLLQCVSALIGAGLAGLLVARVARAVHPLWAGLLCLPFLFSPYIFQSAAYLLPDNASWLLVLAGVLLCVGPWSGGRAMLLGVVIALAVFVRQPLIWLVLPAAAASWLSLPPPAAPSPSLRQLFLGQVPARLGRLVIALIALLPALVVLGLFYRLWHGLTPPRFQSQHQGLGISTPIFVLANLGMASVCFSPLLWPVLRHLWSEARGSVVLVGVGAAALGVVEPTTFDQAAGRFSGLWTLAGKLPHVGHVSVLIFVLGAAGGVALLCWLALFEVRQRVILLVCIVGFTAAQTANHLTLQRYVEPFVLMLIPFAAARAMGVFPGARRRMLVGGVVLLAFFQIALNIHGAKLTFTSESYPRADSPIQGGPFIPPEERRAPAAGDR